MRSSLNRKRCSPHPSWPLRWKPTSVWPLSSERPSCDAWSEYGNGSSEGGLFFNYFVSVFPILMFKVTHALNFVPANWWFHPPISAARESACAASPTTVRGEGKEARKGTSDVARRLKSGTKNNIQCLMLCCMFRIFIYFILDNALKHTLLIVPLKCHRLKKYPPVLVTIQWAHCLLFNSNSILILFV